RVPVPVDVNARVPIDLNNPARAGVFDPIRRLTRTAPNTHQPHSDYKKCRRDCCKPPDTATEPRHFGKQKVRDRKQNHSSENNGYRRCGQTKQGKRGHNYADPCARSVVRTESPHISAPVLCVSRYKTPKQETKANGRHEINQSRSPDGKVLLFEAMVVEDDRDGGDRHRDTRKQSPSRGMNLG